VSLVVRIPGEPVAQGRPRFSTRGGFVRAFDPLRSRNWKATAQEHFRRAMERRGLAPLAGALRCDILAVFTCPRSTWRKRQPRAAEPHAKKPDPENVAKAVLDAGNGVLWGDDSQIADLRVAKVIGAQGEPPSVLVRVREAHVPTRYRPSFVAIDHNAAMRSADDD